MKKRILSLVLVVSILSSLIVALPITASAARSGMCGDNLAWTLDDDGALTISGTGPMYDYEYTGAPWYSISSSITSITIGNSVTSIGEYAFFGCSGLTSITIPNSVTSIGDDAFSGCSGLTSITIPNSVTSIGEYTFFGCSGLTSITIPDSVTSIGDYAFNYCSGLTSITIPNSVTSIGNGTFYYCSGLTSITIPNSVTSIGNGTFYYCSGLTSITIPDNVTSIGEYAFNYCSGLTSITIPDSVTSIGDGAFHYCSGLTSITIPDSVTSIGYRAFFCCSGLTSITIGNSVTSIGTSAFAYCSGLRSITIPDSVTSIGEYAFSGCSGLTSITIPNSVTSIGTSAFSGCSGLTDVYYDEGEEDWERISIGANNDRLINATIHYLEYEPKEYEYISPIIISNGKFKFASGKGNANFDYHDYYFKNSAYSYNHDLAKMSMRLALSAYATSNVKTQHENAQDLLEKLKFQGIEHNDWYEKEPKRNSIGVIAGRKHVIYPDGNYTLIAVAVRGGGYENEWGGNFNVGSGDHHAGFATARDQVIEFIKKYIKNQRIGGNIKLWITGFSRAAATANLTAAYFDENPYETGKYVTLTPENIYAYCFETPAGVVKPDNESGLYDNIFSIVNQHDFVPMVAMRKWGYDRYGITKYLPAAQTNRDYNTLKNKMIPLYDEYIGNNRDIPDDEKKPYKIDSFSKYTYWSAITFTYDLYNAQGVYLEKLIDGLAESVGNSSNYENEYQDAFEYVGEYIIGTGNYELFATVFATEFLWRWDLKQFAGVAGSLFSNKYIVRQALVSTFDYIGIEVDKDSIEVILDFILKLGFDDFVTILKNAGNFGQAHYPELCMAWLDAIDEDDFTDRRLRTLYLNCPVDLEVYDSKDNLVAAIYNDELQTIDGSSITAFIDDNGQKVVYLPQDEEYRIEVISTDAGEVTYSIQEQDSSTAQTKIINYNNMTVSKGDILIGTAENLTTTENAAYDLKSGTVDVSEAEIIENAEPIDIEFKIEGNGSTTNIDLVYKGEYAKVVAVPFENEEFLGWYNGETLVSNDAEYRFQVTEAITLTAKFSENTCEIVFLDNEDYVIASERIVKGSTVTIPQAPEKEGYMFDGFYKDREYTAKISEGDIYLKDTTLYARYIGISSIVYNIISENLISVDGVKGLTNAYDGGSLNWEEVDATTINPDAEEGTKYIRPKTIDGGNTSYTMRTFFPITGGKKYLVTHTVYNNSDSNTLTHDNAGMSAVVATGAPVYGTLSGLTMYSHVEYGGSNSWSNESAVNYIGSKAPRYDRESNAGYNKVEYIIDAPVNAKNIMISYGAWGNEDLYYGDWAIYEIDVTYDGSVTYTTDINEIQSKHEYSNNINQTWVYTHPTDAEYLWVKFSPETCLAEYDYVYIYGKNDKLIGNYSTDELQSKTISVEGNVIKIRLFTNENGTHYGFRVTDIVEADKPKMVWANAGWQYGISYGVNNDMSGIYTLPEQLSNGNLYTVEFTLETSGNQSDTLIGLNNSTTMTYGNYFTNSTIMMKIDDNSIKVRDGGTTLTVGTLSNAKTTVDIKVDVDLLNNKWGATFTENGKVVAERKNMSFRNVNLPIDALVLSDNHYTEGCLHVDTGTLIITQPNQPSISADSADGTLTVFLDDVPQGKKLVVAMYNNDGDFIGARSTVVTAEENYPFEIIKGATFCKILVLSDIISIEPFCKFEEVIIAD